MPSDSQFFDQIVSASGIELDVDRMDPAAVSDQLDWSYGLNGPLNRIDTEKDDTFLLEAGTRRLLVKVAPFSEDPAVVDLQSAVMRHLEQKAPHLPVQRLIPGVDGQLETPILDSNGRTRVLRVMSYLDGTLLCRATPSDLQLRRVGATMARVDDALADFRHPSDGRLLLWDLKVFAHMRRLVEYVEDPAQRDLAYSVFDRFERCVAPVIDSLETQMIHGDFSPFNVLMDADRHDFVAGVIDFGDVMHSPVLFELSVAVANQLGIDETDPWGRAVAIVRGYREVRPVPDDTAELLAITGPARLLLRALVYGWRAVVDPRSRDYGLLHSAQDWSRLQLALAIDDDKVRQRIAASGVSRVS